MFRTALVPIELSPSEGPMLACLDEIGALGVKRLVLLHVVEVGHVKGAEYGHEEKVRTRLEHCAERLRRAGFEVETEVRDSGVVTDTILQAAGDAQADLIVIGSRGKTMLEGLFLGSVAREVIRQSPLPVRIEWLDVTGKEGERVCERVCHRGLKRLMLATDLSARARAAEDAVETLAPRAEIVDLVHVIGPDEMARNPRWKVMARAALDSIADDIAAAGGKAEIHLPEGKPSQEIARLATQREADLIVVGKQGHGWLEGILTGSTAINLSEIARRPVLIVPARTSEA